MFFLYRTSAACRFRPSGEKMTASVIVFDQLQGQQPVVNFHEIRPVHLDHVNFQLIAVQVVVEALQEFFRPLVKEECTVDEIDPEHPGGLLLEQGILFVEAGVEHHRVGLA